ncbi:hypothetical protein BHM03_00046057 [Ensete ventricosum]|nr:hypothetical protein BHM03_00046057 [Ensete ventricosum]
MLEPNLVPAQRVRSAPVSTSGNCWFRPLCASSPVVVSGWSRCSARWMDPSYPVAGVGCWSGGVRVRRRHLRSGREPAPAKRSCRGVDLTYVRSDVRPLGIRPYLCQVGCMTAGAPTLASSFPRRVDHVDGPVVRGRENVTTNSSFAISILYPCEVSMIKR